MQGIDAYCPRTALAWTRGTPEATYIDRIFKGAQPTDLPVEKLTAFELTVSLKAAKALGFTIPSSMMARSDKVIE